MPETLFTPIMVFLLGFIILAAALIILGETGTLRGQFSRSLDVELVSKYPTILAVGPDACSGDTCTYAMQIRGLALKAKSSTGDALISVKYKGQQKLLPCPVSPQPNGACVITTDGIGFNVSPTFSGNVYSLPPTLIANAANYTSADGVIFDGQTVVVGNFSIKFSYLELPTVLLEDRARYTVRCADDGGTIIQSKGEESRYTMCGGEIRIKTVDIWRWTAHKVCADIVTTAGRNWTYYDSVDVTVWNSTLLGCANITFTPQQIALSESIPLSDETVTRCFDHRITSWSFDVPVTPWNRATWQQPEC